MTVVRPCEPPQRTPGTAGATKLPLDIDSLMRMQRDLTLLEVLARVAATDDTDLAVQELVDSLQRWLNVRQVVIGERRGRRHRCRVKAISAMRTFSRQSRIVRSFEAVMNEAVLRNELDAKDLSSIESGKATVLQGELAHAANATAVVNGPLRNRDGEVIGAWVALDNNAKRSVSVVADAMRAAEARVGLCLHVLWRSQRRSISSRLSLLYEKRKRSRRLAIAAGVLALVAVLAIPWPFKLSCTSSVQPVMRRYIVAPYEGMLKEAYVEPGDSVTEGQLLARMDEREIKWELAGLEAEYSRAEKERDTNLAGLDTAAAQLSQLEMKRLKLKIRLLENRENHLEIKSPVGGVVISGDPKKMEGARLTIGQTLLEIGPLDRMVLEVAIPDEDISHARVGQRVKMRFESQPTRDYEGAIAKIHPRAETKEKANVFIAEVPLNNVDGTLRPGMQGRAWVKTESHPIAWNLFHKVWQRVAFRMGW